MLHSTCLPQFLFPSRHSSQKKNERKKKGHKQTADPMAQNVNGNRVNIKSKVAPLYAIDGAWAERMCSSYSFLTSALEGREWSASRPCSALSPVHPYKGWVCPTAGLKAEARRKFSAYDRDKTPVVQSVVRC
jgi:hypothetical protein